MFYVGLASFILLLVVFKQYVIIVGVLVSLGILSWFKDKIKSGHAIIGTIKRVVNEDLKDRLQVWFKAEGPYDFDIVEYIGTKTNKSTLVVGGVRTGKTLEAEFLCLKLPCKKIVVSFKKFHPNRRDFDIGYTWIDLSKQLPNFWKDPKSVVSAFRTAFFVDTNVGLMIDTILDKFGEVLAENPKSFEEFFKILESQAKRNDWETNITNLVASKMKLIQRSLKDAKQGTIDFSKGNIVLDAGNIDSEQVKTFVVETLIRQIARVEEQAQNSEKIYLVIDECWHLLTSKSQRSYLGEILLQGAYYIHVLCVTPSYSHLDENYQSLFGTILCFHNNSTEDGDAIEKGFSPFLSEAVKKLKSSEAEVEYHFIDLKFSSNDDFVPVWQMDKDILDKAKAEAKQNVISETAFEADTNDAKEAEKEQEHAVAEDELIIKILEKNEFCMTAHAITNALGYTEKDYKRGNIHGRNLPDLERDGKIKLVGYVTTTLKVGMKPKKYYYSIPTGESQIHRTILKDVKCVLNKLGLKFTESQVNQWWDIETKNFYCDGKSGLQHDVKDDLRKLQEKETKKVIFVCVNYEVKKRYENTFSSVEGIEGKYQVCCLNELSNIILGLEKNV